MRRVAELLDRQYRLLAVIPRDQIDLPSATSLRSVFVLSSLCCGICSELGRCQLRTWMGSSDMNESGLLGM